MPSLMILQRATCLQKTSQAGFGFAFDTQRKYVPFSLSVAKLSGLIAKGLLYSYKVKYQSNIGKQEELDNKRRFT